MKKINEIERIRTQWKNAWSKESLHKSISCVKLDEKLPYFLKHLSRNGKILEAGCGLGQWVVYLSELGYDIIGVDIVEEVIDRAKKSFPGLRDRFIVGDVSSLNFSDNTFDAYISLGVIEHFLEGPHKALLEMKRVLKPQGIAIVYVPIYNYFWRIVYFISNSLHCLKRNNMIRRCFGKEEISYDKETERKKFIFQDVIAKRYKHLFFPTYLHDPEKGRVFFEYKWLPGKLEGVIKKYDFEVLESKCLGYDSFIYQHFGGIARAKQRYNINILGKFLRNFTCFFSPYILAHGEFYIARNNK